MSAPDPDVVEIMAAEIMPLRNDHEHSAQDMIRAALAALEREGFVVVPREPTEEMLRATEIVCAGGDFLGNIQDPGCIWSAMLSVAFAKQKNDNSSKS